MLVLSMAGCGGTPDPVPTAEADGLPEVTILAKVTDGHVVMTCHFGCSYTWGSNLREMENLEALRAWARLAIMVYRTGYENDLAYYYLGRAAEGLDAKDAALAYYQIAAALSTNGDPRVKCDRWPAALCNGLKFPDAAESRIKLLAAK